MKIVRHHFLALISVGLLGTICSASALHRVSDRVIIADPGWPRARPFPDQGLAAAEQWLSDRNPPDPDSVKLHGEFARVRALLLVPLVLAVQSLIAGVLRLIHAWNKPRLPELSGPTLRL
jgi:hypothetical protein